MMFGRFNSLSHFSDALKTKLFTRRLSEFELYASLFKERSGIEIGGPSRIFKSNDVLPLYGVVKALDGSNYSGDTLWSTHGGGYEYDQSKNPGKMFIAEATGLSQINDNSYDFLFASHVIEHSANPLKAVKEWSRIVKSGGHLLIIAPDPERTFDHRRQPTTFDHILSDFNADMQEDDLTHLEEVLELHDLKRDFLAGNYESFKERCTDNKTYRGIHHHLFSEELFRRIAEFLSLRIIRYDRAFPYHLIVLIENTK